MEISSHTSVQSELKADSSHEGAGQATDFAMICSLRWLAFSRHANWRYFHGPGPLPAPGWTGLKAGHPRPVSSDPLKYVRVAAALRRLGSYRRHPLARKDLMAFPARLKAPDRVSGHRFAVATIH